MQIRAHFKTITMSVIIGLLVAYIIAAVNNIAKIFANENQSIITNVMAFGVVFAVIGATVFSVLLLQRWRNRDGEKETSIPFYTNKAIFIDSQNFCQMGPSFILSE